MAAIPYFSDCGDALKLQVYLASLSIICAIPVHNLSVHGAGVLVGESGSGKSTIIALLERVYHPSSGRILLDGRDAAEFNINNYRSFFALVSQDIALYDGTIAWMKWEKLWRRPWYRLAKTQIFTTS